MDNTHRSNQSKVSFAFGASVLPHGNNYSNSHHQNADYWCCLYQHENKRLTAYGLSLAVKQSPHGRLICDGFSNRYIAVAYL